MAHRHALEVDFLSLYVAEKKLRLLELKTPRISSETFVALTNRSPLL